MNTEALVLMCISGLLAVSAVHAQDSPTAIFRDKAVATTQAATRPATTPATAAPAPAINKWKTRSVSQASKELIASGKLRAVEGGASVVVSENTLAGHAARKEIFLAFERNQPQVAKLPEALQEPGKEGEKGTLLSQDVIVVKDNGELRRVHPYVRNSTGLSFVGARNRFEGRIAVALAYADAATNEPFPKPVSVQVTANTAEIDPEKIEIKEVDIWHSVNLAVLQPGSEYEVVVIAGAKGGENSIKIPVHQPTLNLASSVSRVVGFGLGTFRVTVTAPRIREPEGTLVSLESDGAEFEDSNVVKLDSNGTGMLKLRSTSSGVATIFVQAPFENSSVQVEFKQPWLILALAAIGGIVGVVVKRRGKRSWLVAMVGGLAGLALTVLYLLGIDWLVGLTGKAGLSTAGEFVAFGLGFIVSFYGVHKIKLGPA